MEWRDSGFVLAARRHGESAAIVEILTAEHGRHAGLVRGGQSPKRRALLQPGNAVAITWRARLPEHLGTLDCELERAHAARFLDDPERLAALAAASSLIAATVPEREPHPDIHRSFAALVEALDFGRGVGGALRPVGRRAPGRARLWARPQLLRGHRRDRRSRLRLAPHRPRGVARRGRDYRDKLLPLPDFLVRNGDAEPRAVVAASSSPGTSSTAI